MALVIKKSSGTPFCEELKVACPGPHVDIIRYDMFFQYLSDELEQKSHCSVLCSEALIVCLVKHRQLISGKNLWSPGAHGYVEFDKHKHGQFAALKPSGEPTVVQFVGKLLPFYCKLCFYTQCHNQAHTVATALLKQMTTHFSEKQNERDQVAEFEIGALEYIIYNLNSYPPAEVGDVARSPDVTVETKVAVELLWSHLVKVYAGKRKLLLCNLELFFTRPVDSSDLCPSELRAALFAHGKHETFCERGYHSTYSRQCPVSTPRPKISHSRARTGVSKVRHLYESRISRLCWLAALWVLDFQCNRRALNWIYKPDPLRTVPKSYGSQALSGAFE